MRMFLTALLVLNSIAAFNQDDGKELRAIYSKNSIELLDNYLNHWNNESMQLCQKRSDTVAKFDPLIASFNNENKMRGLRDGNFQIFDYRSIIFETFESNEELENEIRNLVDSVVERSRIDLNHLKAVPNYFMAYKYENDIISRDSISNYYPPEVDRWTLLLTDTYNNTLCKFVGSKNTEREKEFLRQRINGFYLDGRSFCINKKIMRISLSSSSKLAIIDWRGSYCWGQELYLNDTKKWIKIMDIEKICE